MKSGQTDAAATLAASVLNGLLILGTQSCLAWSLGTAGRGEYAVCVVLSVLLSAVFGLGVEMAVGYYVGAKRLTFSDAMAAGLAWAVLSSLVGIGAGWVLTSLPLAFVDKAPLTALRLSLLLLPTMLCALVFTRVLIGLGEIVLFNVSSVARAMLVLLLTVVLVWYAELGVYGALAGLLIGDVFQMGIIAFQLRRRHQWHFVRPSADALRRLLSYGARFYAGKLGRQLHMRLGTVLLTFLATKGDVGLFAAALALMAGVWMIPDAANIVLLPRTTRDESGTPELVAKCCRFSAASALLVVIPVLLFAKPLVVIVLSPEFLPVIPLMQILALGTIVRSYPRVLASYFNGIERPGLNSAIILSGLLVNAVLLLLLLPRYSLPGAALALSIAYGVETILAVVWFVRISGEPATRLVWFDRSDWVEIRSLARKFRWART